MSDILSQIVARKRERLAEARRRRPFAALRAEAQPRPAASRFITALRRA
jgi:indole-3-glycerol phosphate synthase